MKRLILLFGLGAALTTVPALANEGRLTASSEREHMSAIHAATHDKQRDCDPSSCCARRVTSQPEDVSSAQRDREGWGGAG